MKKPNKTLSSRNTRQGGWIRFALISGLLAITVITPPVGRGLSQVSDPRETLAEESSLLSRTLDTVGNLARETCDLLSDPPRLARAITGASPPAIGRR